MHCQDLSIVISLWAAHAAAGSPRIGKDEECKEQLVKVRPCDPFPRLQAQAEFGACPRGLLPPCQDTDVQARHLRYAAKSSKFNDFVGNEAANRACSQ